MCVVAQRAQVSARFEIPVKHVRGDVARTVVVSRVGSAVCSFITKLVLLEGDVSPKEISQTLPDILPRCHHGADASAVTPNVDGQSTFTSHGLQLSQLIHESGSTHVYAVRQFWARYLPHPCVGLRWHRRCGSLPRLCCRPFLARHRHKNLRQETTTISTQDENPGQETNTTTTTVTATRLRDHQHKAANSKKSAWLSVGVWFSFLL